MKPVLIRAFTSAKNKMKSKSKYSDDYITRGEYRWLLMYLRIYYEYWVAFDRVDTDDDRRIDFNEFEKAQATMKQWGINITNIEVTWKEVDKNGGGKVLFDEFANWAIKKGLDLDDDDDVTDSDIEVQEIDREDATRRRLKKYRADKIA